MSTQLETESSLELDNLEELSEEELAALQQGDDPLEGLYDEPSTEEEKDKDLKNPEDEEEGDEEEEEPSTEYVPGTTLKKLLEENKLPYNEDQLPKDFNIQQELELINQVNDRLRTQLKKNVEDANTLTKLYKEDEEVLSFLEARKQGKTMKDYIAELAKTPAYTDADALVLKHLQEVALFSAEDASSELQRLKDNGKFDDRKAAVVKYYEAKTAAEAAQRAAEESNRLANEAAEKAKMDKEFASLLQKTESVGEFKFTKKIREDLFDYVTLEAQDGFNGLERDLQSDDNVLKAALAIKYWDAIQASLKNASRQETSDQLLDRLTSGDPSALQSSSSRQSPRSDKLDAQLLNSF